MKNIVFILWFCMSAISLQAQKAMSRADKMNILYLGIDNPISIMADVPLQGITFEVPNASLKPVSPGKFLINPSKTGTLELTFKYKGKIIGVEKYRVQSMPPAKAFFDNIDDEAKLDLSNIKSQIGIKCILPDFHVKYNIVSFKMRHIRNGVKIATIENKGPIFGSEILSIFNQLKSGDEILFSNINYRMNVADGDHNINTTLEYTTQNPYIRIVVK